MGRVFSSLLAPQKLILASCASLHEQNVQQLQKYGFQISQSQAIQVPQPFYFLFFALLLSNGNNKRLCIITVSQVVLSPASSSS
ncbi:hypothetical protein XENTR_v10013264 [Xenopus tropicalis]|nr:hypothetical protein XENTR_v10013264 [Xenopus tropicalis]